LRTRPRSFQTRYHDDLASVKALEEALGSDKFSQLQINLRGRSL
jgi:hypothetical protein